MSALKSSSATRTDTRVSNVSGDSTQGHAGYAEIDSPYDDITEQAGYAEYEDINEPLAVNGYTRDWNSLQEQQLINHRDRELATTIDLVQGILLIQTTQRNTLR